MKPDRYLGIVFLVVLVLLVITFWPDAPKPVPSVQAQTPTEEQRFGPEVKQENVMRDGVTMPRITYIYTHTGDSISVFRDNKTMCEYILSDHYYGASSPVLVPDTCQKEKKR